jgi:hypothetical protein
MAWGPHYSPAEIKDGWILAYDCDQLWTSDSALTWLRGRYRDAEERRDYVFAELDTLYDLIDRICSARE